jgi:predicted SnoaL-like aldol condensation-catalyzing enzyme
MYEAYEKVFNQGRYELAGDYFEADFREHNSDIADGVQASIDHQKRVGGYSCTILRTVHDENFWYVHSIFRIKPTDFSVVDIYRLNPAGKVVEHWDSVMMLVGDGAHRTIEGPAGSGEVLSGEEKAQRRTFLRALYDEAIWRKTPGGVDRFLAKGFIERNCGIGPLPGLRERASSPNHLDEVRLIGIEGDMACVFSNYQTEEGIIHVSEIFRFDAAGLIAEHWDIAQYVPANTSSDASNAAAGA